MFRLLGNKVELVRYIVTWQETQGEETIEMEERCVSEEHKNEIEQKLTERGIPFSTESITQAGNEWFEGLEFDSYDVSTHAPAWGATVAVINLRIPRVTANVFANPVLPAIVDRLTSSFVSIQSQ